MLRYVPADPALIAEGRRRALLTRIAASRGWIRVTNPDHPDGAWVGRIHGLMDYPSIVLEDSQGKRWTVPQHFAIEEVSEDEAADPAEDRVNEALKDWERELLHDEAVANLAAAEKKLATLRSWGIAHLGSPHLDMLLAILDGPEPGPAASQAPPRPTAAEAALSQAKAALHRLACDEDMAQPNMTERESRCQYAREALDLIGRIESGTGTHAVSRFTPAEGHGCQHPEASHG